MNLKSDNVLGCAPEILEALARANTGTDASYGADAITARLQRQVSELFEHEAFVLPVSTGIAANGLSLAALTPPWGAIYCHDLAHISRDEWCAPEFFTGGARLQTIHAPHARITPETLSARVTDTLYAARPSVVSLTQATEAGTVYRVEAVQALGEAARTLGLALHMDGARFANAVASLGCHPADITWRAGVDALALGAAKNGTMTAEAIVVFRKSLFEELEHRRRRAGHVSSKMRFLSAQLEAYFADGLWLRLARHANAQASRLGHQLAQRAGVTVVQPVEANLVFASLRDAQVRHLRSQGAEFLDWPSLGPGVVRFVCGWATSDATVDRLLATLDAAP
jgi:threonine aldolase